MSNKRYRLLKDIISPDVVGFKGDIGEYCQGKYYFDKYRYYYHDWRVEKETEWFEEIKEEQPFQWSDALIKEMIYEKLPLPNHYSGNVQKCLNEFRASKQQTNTIPSGEKYKQWDIPMNATITDNQSQPKSEIKEPERIEVIDFEFDHAKKWVRFYFRDSPFLSGNHYLKLKQAIERVLNNENKIGVDIGYGAVSIISESQHKEEIRWLEEKAFNAGRDINGNYQLIPQCYRHKTFEDYKKQNP